MLTSTIDETGTKNVVTISPPPDDDRIGEIMQPAGYRILVEILPPEETLKRWRDSSLQMPPDVQQREWQAQMWAKVIRLGPQAYNNKEKYGDAWCKPGDYIMMRPYVGTRFMLRDHLYALINDDTVQAVVGDVSELERV